MCTRYVTISNIHIINIGSSVIYFEKQCFLQLFLPKILQTIVSCQTRQTMKVSFFDKIQFYSVLVELLHKTFGVSNNALSWFKTCLSSRMAEVHVNCSSSEAKKLDFSVPRGSICGSVLCIAYASTLENYIKDSNVSLVGYADNHSAYDSFNPNNIQNEYMWSRIWKIP